jgi:hypothetical protein
MLRAGFDLVGNAAQPSHQPELFVPQCSFCLLSAIVLIASMITRSPGLDLEVDDPDLFVIFPVPRESSRTPAEEPGSSEEQCQY